MRLLVIGLVAVGCWTVAALVAWAIVHVASRRDDDIPYLEPEDGIQPGDSHTYALMDGASWTYTERLN